MVRAVLPLLLLACAASAISFHATIANEVRRPLEMLTEIQKFSTLDEGAGDDCNQALFGVMFMLAFSNNTDCMQANHTSDYCSSCIQELQEMSDMIAQMIPSLQEECGACNEEMMEMTSMIINMPDYARFMCQTNQNGENCLDIFIELNSTMSEGPPTCETMENMGCCAGNIYQLQDCSEESVLLDCPQVSKQTCSSPLVVCPNKGAPIFADCLDASDAHSSISNVVLALSITIAVMLGVINV